MNLKLKNKRGDIPSLLFAIMSVFIAGIILVVFSHLFMQMYGSIGDYFETTKYKDSIPDKTLEEVIDYEQSIWDYAFLAIAIGYIIMMGILAFSTNVSPVFYFIYGLAAFFGFVVGIALSNLFQHLAEMTQFADTIARFPITNAILGNFFPLYITAMLLITMILLFGKFFGVGGGGLDG